MNRAESDEQKAECGEATFHTHTISWRPHCPPSDRSAIPSSMHASQAQELDGCSDNIKKSSNSKNTKGTIQNVCLSVCQSVCQWGVCV
jgi:hypothetical protein